MEGLRIGLERLTNLRLGYFELFEQGFEDGDMEHVIQVHHRSFRFKVKLHLDLLKFELSQKATFRGGLANDYI